MDQEKEMRKKVNDSLRESTSSYLDLRFNGLDGVVRQLKVPTSWDPVNELWMAVIILTESQTIVKATCKDSFDLQNEFTKEIGKIFAEQDSRSKELANMFEVI